MERKKTVQVQGGKKEDEFLKLFSSLLVVLIIFISVCIYICICVLSLQRDSMYDDLRNSYGRSPAGSDGRESGWITSTAEDFSRMYPSARWHSSDFAAGDVIIFGCDLVHMTFPNSTNRTRISCEARWVADFRWIGFVDYWFASSAKESKADEDSNRSDELEREGFQTLPHWLRFSYPFSEEPVDV